MSGATPSILSEQDTGFLRRSGLHGEWQPAAVTEKFVVPEPPAKKALRRKRWESADIAQQRGVRRLEQILLEGFTPGTAAADTEGSAEGTSTSVIPQFLQRLYLTLPRHSGAIADVDALLEGLATAVLPDKATVTGVADAAADAAAATDDDVDIDMDDAVGASATVDSTIGEHHDVSVDVAGTAVAGVGGVADIDSAAHAQHQQQQQQQQQQQPDHMQHTSAAAAAAGGSSSGHAAYSNGGAMPHQQQQQQQHYQQQQQQQRNGSHKRRRNGDSDDEYDDDNEGASGSHKRPLHDVFRQRQLAKLERAS
eukprot:17180-Heterococcus_DN1.PRE.5